MNALKIKRKGLVRKKKIIQSESMDNFSLDTINSIVLDREVISNRLSTLEKELRSLEEEEEKLDLEKELFIKEKKIMRDESTSKFNNMPILKQRYLLTRLLGKGGFSEVYKAFDLIDLKKVACKIHQVNPSWSEIRTQNYIKHTCREYNIQKELVRLSFLFSFNRTILELLSYMTFLKLTIILSALFSNIAKGVI